MSVQRTFSSAPARWRAGLAFLLWSVTALPVLAACPSSAPGRFVPLPNGTEVRDMETGLVWARCSVGQYWDGSTCAGTASAMTHQEALLHAKDLAGWRLPNVKELATLFDGSCRFPSIDESVFPRTLSNDYWTTTPDISPDTISSATRTSSYARTVGFGEVLPDGFARRRDRLPVRLVRFGW